MGVRHWDQVLATLQPMGAFVSNQFTDNATASPTPRTRATRTGDFGLRGRSVPHRLADGTVRHSIAMADHHSGEFLFSRSLSRRRNPCSSRPTRNPVAQTRPFPARLWGSVIENQCRFQNRSQRGLERTKQKFLIPFRDFGERGLRLVLRMDKTRGNTGSAHPRPTERHSTRDRSPFHLKSRRRTQNGPIRPAGPVEQWRRRSDSNR